MDSKLSRVFDLLPNYVAKYDSPELLASKVRGEWKKLSAKSVLSLINQTSLGLLKLGIKKDDKVAIISPNRPEWNIIDFGIQQIGAVSVPMYPTITIEDYRYIFRDAGVKLVFVANQDLYDKVQAAIREVPEIEGVYSFDTLANAPHWSEVTALAAGEDEASLDAHRAGVASEDLLTLIYTSGTTGVPKGVMLSHGNITSNVEAVTGYVPVDAGERALSFLPLCHIYERMVLYLYMQRGINIFYAESMETIAENLREIKPTVFTTVPRLLEKVYDKIVAKGHELPGTKKRIFFWALNLGLRYDPTQSMGFWYDFQLKWARKLIFSKWQEALGGKVKLIVTGSAALQPRLSRVFWAAGIAVSEGYGLTETSPVVSSSLVIPPDFRVGCVGTVVPGVTVRIAEDGEILVKGPNIMQGYYNKPQQTAEAIDADGWFHTGDIGEMVEGKYLKITDRKKEIFKTSGGKYVAPQMVENKLKESSLIEQAIVVGDGQKFPSALVVPEYEALKNYAKQHDIATDNLLALLDNPKILAKFNEDISAANATIAQYEQVKKFKLLSMPFSIEGGELTPTLKLKRKVIQQKYASLIEQMYA